MENYVDYAWSTDNFLMGRNPVIPEALFTYYATMASAEVRNIITLDADLSDPIDEVKAAVCEIAEIMCQMDGNAESDGDTKVIPVGVSSEKVGEYSVSYTGNSALEKSAERASRIKQAAVKWLGVTGLLFRGV